MTRVKRDMTYRLQLGERNRSNVPSFWHGPIACKCLGCTILEVCAVHPVLAVNVALELS